MLKKKRIIGTKILVIIAVIVVLILGLVKIFETFNSDEDEYEFTNIFQNLSDKYNYLFSLKPVYINLNPNELQRIATSNKVLSQKEFKLIMNDLITNGYIQPGIMNIVIKIKNRKFEEDNNKIKIIDISREPCSLANDVPGIKSSCISKVTLNYIYYKDNGDIILESEREYT